MSGKIRNPARRCKICGGKCKKRMRYCKLCDHERKRERGDCAGLHEDLVSPECQVKPLTLDEAIAHADEVAGDCGTACRREHKQLADWLRELKAKRSAERGNAAKAFADWLFAPATEKEGGAK